MQLTKLKWRCRRGTQELDKLLLNYLENNYLTAPLAEQQSFQKLLALEDSQLLQLFFNEQNSTESELDYLAKKIRHHAML